MSEWEKTAKLIADQVWQTLQEGKTVRLINLIITMQGADPRMGEASIGPVTPVVRTCAMQQGATQIVQ